MAKFFISFLRGGEISEDDEGQDFPGLQEAGMAAMVSARELLADHIKAGSKTPLEAVIIKNDRGQEVLRIPAREVLPEPLR
jgi:hypothetical protein